MQKGTRCRKSNSWDIEHYMLKIDYTHHSDFFVSKATSIFDLPFSERFWRSEAFKYFFNIYFAHVSCLKIHEINLISPDILEIFAFPSRTDAII